MKYDLFYTYFGWNLSSKAPAHSVRRCFVPSLIRRVFNHFILHQSISLNHSSHWCSLYPLFSQGDLWVPGESSCENNKLFNEFLIYSACGYCYWTTRTRFSVIVLCSLNLFSNFWTDPLYHFSWVALYKYDTRSNLFQCNDSLWQRSCHHLKTPFWRVFYADETKFKRRTNFEKYIDENLSNNTDLEWRLWALLLSYSVDKACAITKHKVMSFSLFFHKNLFEFNSCTAWKCIGVF